MLNENHCNVKSPIIIDKKYPEESIWKENYHAIKGNGTNGDHPKITVD